MTRFSIAPLLLAFTLASPLASAQTVSDADRAAARELYVQGVKLQEAGRFADALDKFQRAQAVFSAPTHLLHIAECEAALGKLVESAEAYRTLVRTPLPQGAPNAFVQAQQQGAAELTQVEPRIPSIRLVVKPENARNLQVQVDGQPMSAALVGVHRPIDPGQHTISVSAAGYARADQQVAVKEKEQKEVTVTLQPSNGIVYTPAPATLPPPPGVIGAESQPPPPYDQRPPEYQGPPERRPASGGFMIGPRLGLLAPGGNFASNQSIGDRVSSGLSFGLEGGFRFARRFYIGAVFEHGFHGRGSGIDPLVGQVPNGDTLTTSQSTNYLGLDFTYISNPDGLAFYGEIGLGYRALNAEYQTSTTDSTPSYGGGEAEIGVGLHIKAGDWVRIVPKISLAAGQFSSLSCSQSGASNGLPQGLNCQDLGGSGGSSIQNQDTHSFVFLGATAFFDFARKH